MNLCDERKWAIDTVKELAHKPIAFELDPAAEHAKKWWKSKIADSDIVVLLIGREISLPVFDEVETARKHRSIIFAFAKDEDCILRKRGKSLHNLGLSDTELRRFYEFLTSIKFKPFKDQDDLKKEITSAIASIPPKLYSVPEPIVIRNWELERIKILYVPPTRKYEKAKKILENNKFLIIAGPPHIGKTSMAYFLLSVVKEKFNLDTVVRCTEYRDISLLFNQQNVGILVDDPFGKVKFESTSTGRYIDEIYWKMKEKHEKQKEKANYLIVTSRENVFEEALENTKLNEIPKDTIVGILQEGDYSTSDLTRILENHLDYYLERKSINQDEFLLAKAAAQRIIEALRFPHNIAFFVENFVNGLRPENLDRAIKGAQKIKEEVEKWYVRFDRKKEYELKFFVFTAALLPDSHPSALGMFYKAFISGLNEERRMGLSLHPVSYMRNRCSAYITENGLVNFKHPSYLEGVINQVEKQQSDDLVLFLNCIQPMLTQPVSPFIPIKSQSLNMNIWDVIHVLRVAARIVPTHSLPLLGNLVKNARERGVLEDMIGIVEQIGKIDPGSIMPLLEKLAEMDDAYQSAMRVFGKISEVEPSEVLVYLEKLLSNRENWFLRPYIASVLGKIGGRNPDKALPLLEKLLLDGTQYGVSSAMEALITIGQEYPSEVMPILERISQKKVPHLKYSIEWAIKELKMID